MSSTFISDEFSISLVVPVSTLQNFSLDNLYKLGIADPAWKLTRRPQYTSEGIRLEFDRGAMLIQPQRIGFLHRQSNLEVSTSWIIPSTRRCLTAFPTLIYEGFGLQLTGHLLNPNSITSTEELLRQNLMPVNACYAVEQVQPLINLDLIYPLPGREMKLTLAEGGVVEQGVTHPAVIFQASLLYNVCDTEPEARAIAMHHALDRCIVDIDLCQTLINQYCRRLLAPSINSVPSHRRRRRRSKTPLKK